MLGTVTASPKKTVSNTRMPKKELLDASAVKAEPDQIAGRPAGPKQEDLAEAMDAPAARTAASL